jgi:membrane associated rhomboid family serine protease
MSTGKNQTFIYTAIGFLLAVTLFAPNSSIHGACLHSPFWNKLTYHLYHANIFHFIANAYALCLMRPSPSDMLKAFPLAVAASIFTKTPTVGISAMIYAYIGMNITKWKVSMIDWATFIVANLITIFIPNVAFGVHLAAFLLGISVHITHSKINRILLTLEGK